MASAGAVTKALQALNIRSSHLEQQLNNLQLTHKALNSELQNFVDLKFRMLNNNIHATWGTVARGFAIQANGGRLHALNNPDALLDKVIQPMQLICMPTYILQL